ncbi:MAG: pyridoxal-phosphate dependent enzyme [Micromonosporaceae bacterium]|nr:pyridoxal-phosphate dependent enzyme [Micromonosporaceae bacterium]
MGEGLTPLVPAPAAAGVAGLRLKLEYLAPTGSFKDRGAVLLAILARRLGVARMVADSSGNAGAAIAAYAARAGVACEVFLPAGTSSSKVAQLAAFGATVRVVDGDRTRTAQAAQAAIGSGVLYASHVYHPLFLHGTKTYVYELFEQYGGGLPELLVVPVGNGTLLLGAWLGCQELLAQRLIDRVPRLVAVQAAACAPLAGSGEVAPTLAEGIAIPHPPRAAQIVQAVRDSGGEVVTVTEAQIAAAHRELAASGFYVEPTAAVCWAAVRAGAVRPAQGGAVLPLTGSGLKAKPPG